MRGGAQTHKRSAPLPCVSPRAHAFSLPQQHTDTLAHPHARHQHDQKHAQYASLQDCETTCTHPHNMLQCNQTRKHTHAGETPCSTPSTPTPPRTTPAPWTGLFAGKQIMDARDRDGLHARNTVAFTDGTHVTIQQQPLAPQHASGNKNRHKTHQTLPSKTRQENGSPSFNTPHHITTNTRRNRMMRARGHTKRCGARGTWKTQTTRPTRQSPANAHAPTDNYQRTTRLRHLQSATSRAPTAHATSSASSHTTSQQEHASTNGREHIRASHRQRTPASNTAAHASSRHLTRSNTR